MARAVLTEASQVQTLIRGRVAKQEEVVAEQPSCSGREWGERLGISLSSWHPAREHYHEPQFALCAVGVIP